MALSNALYSEKDSFECAVVTSSKMLMKLEHEYQDTHDETFLNNV
jgi:hypothetical protein